MIEYETYIGKKINYRIILIQYVKSWYLFAISVCLFLVIALLFNTFSKPVYKVSSLMLIKDQRNSNLYNSTEGLGTFSFFEDTKTFQNELLVIKSSPLVFRSINELNFDVSYVLKEKFGKKELYKENPFIVRYDSSQPQPIDVLFEIEFLNKNEFNIRLKAEDIELYDFRTHKVVKNIDKINLKKNYSVGEDITDNDYKFNIIINTEYFDTDFENNKYYFKFNNIKRVAKGYKSAIKVEPINREVTVASISLKTRNVNKAKDIIDYLIQNYNNKNLAEKNFIAINTIKYIDSQLENISDSLKLTETSLQDYRVKHQVLDITLKSGRTYEKLEELERNKAELIVQLKYYQYIKEYIEESKNISDLIVPSSMGIDDPVFNSLIQQLTTLYSEKQNLIDNNQQKSPYLKQINIKIDNLKNSIIENVNYMVSTLNLEINDVDKKLNQINRDLNNLPKTERELYGIERKFNINDAVYTYLLEKRTEAQIAKASNLPDNEIIESADIEGGSPIFPKKRLNYFLAFMLGLFVPVIYLRLRDILYNKFYDYEEFENNKDFQLLGQIFHNRRNNDLVVSKYPASSVSECFRTIRTNLDFYFTNEKSKIIIFTSSIAMEGKSFIALNIGTAYANFGKKVLLVSFDMRKPKEYKGLVTSNNIGLSNYLISQANIADIIQETNINGLDYILAGIAPPNPYNLIVSEKTNELLTYLRSNYDFILIDTPPIGIVSDALLLSKYSDLIVYIVRRNYVSRDFFYNSYNQLKNKKLNELCVVFNDSKVIKSRYGYGYYEKKSNIIFRVFRKGKNKT